MTAADLFERFGKASRNQKLAGLVVVSLIIGAVFYFVFYSDVVQTVDRMDSRIRTALQEKASYEEKERRYDDFRREVDKLREEQKELLKVLPSDAEIPSFLQSIHAQGELAGLNILTFEQAPERAQQFYAVIPVKMEIIGTYFQINRFFYSIGQLKRIVNVRDIKLAVPGTPTEAGVMLKADFVASTFRFLTAPAPPPPPPPRG